MDLDSLTQDLERFQNDPTVNVALKKGVDLKEYWKSTERELKDLQTKSLEEYMSDEVLLTASKLHLKFDKALKTLDSADTVVKGFQVRRRRVYTTHFVQNITFKQHRRVWETYQRR